ncbi:MAG TPA: hypothetical protein DDX92_12015 [Flavobacteriales bacterium]|jgi:hypothetical protein|nr:hypothetical protein [Flavobacteriales bacterium]
MGELLLSEDEQFEMRQFYLTELEKAERKVRHLRSVLGKLNVGEIESAVENSKMVGPKVTTDIEPTTDIKKPRRKRRKKRGRKSLWGNFIIKLLKEKDRPLTYNSVIFSAIDRFNIPEDKHKNVKQAITNSAFRLRSVNDKIDTFGLPGKKEKFLCLKGWFKENGELKEKYTAMIVEDSTE